MLKKLYALCFFICIIGISMLGCNTDKFSFLNSNITIDVGETINIFDLEHTGNFNNFDKIELKAEDNNIIEINNLTITALACGQTKIIVYLTGNTTITREIKIRVIDNTSSDSTDENNGNGSVNSGEEDNKGENGGNDSGNNENVDNPNDNNEDGDINETQKPNPGTDIPNDDEEKTILNYEISTKNYAIFCNYTIKIFYDDIAISDFKYTITENVSIKKLGNSLSFTCKSNLHFTLTITYNEESLSIKI